MNIFSGMNIKKLVLCAATLCALVAVAGAQMNAPRGKAEATIKGKQLTIDYGQPSLKGRDIFAMVQPGMVWRLGMNQATQIETTGDLVVGQHHTGAEQVEPGARAGGIGDVRAELAEVDDRVP